MVPDVSRRSSLLGLGSGLVGAVAAVADLPVGLAESDSGDADLDWPMARYDAAGTGYDPDASGPKDGVQVRWQRELDGFSGGTASPVLLDDAVYATGQRLVALDAATGATRFGHGGSYRSSPARAEARAYATDTLAVSAPAGVFGLNAGGGVRLFDREFGVERWFGPGRESASRLFGPPTSPPPVAAEGTVYAAVPGTEHVVALGASSGRERWRASPGDELRRPAVRNGRLFAVNWPYRVTAYDAETGKERWQTDLSDQMVLPPTATSEGVVVPRRTGVTALEAGDGSVRWRFDHDGNATEGAAAVAEESVYVQSGGDGGIYALDLETGEKRWQAPLHGEGTPVVADAVVYASRGPHSELVALDAADGTVRWRFDSRLPLSTPAVGDGALYVVGHDRVVALEERR